MTTTLNVAIVGYGMAGSILHAPLVAATPGLRVHTVVSSNPEKVRSAFPDAVVVSELAQALSDPAVDLVVIATPDTLHAPQAKAALEAGKPVVVDKPFAVTLDDARAVIAASEASGKMVSVFQNRRWDGDYLTLRRLMGEGRLGEVMQFESHYDRFRPVPLGLWKEQREAGVWQDLGPHLVDQTLQLFGEPLGVYADMAAQKPGITGDYFHVLLRYERLRVILHASQMMPSHSLRFSVHGTGGSFIKYGLDSQEEELKRGGIPGSEGWGLDPRRGTLIPAIGAAPGEPEEVVEEPGNYLAYYAAVRDAILHGAPNPVPPQQALAVMRVLEAGRLSAERRREVSMTEAF